MLLGLGYLFKFVLFFFLFFFQKAENNRLEKASWPKFCNIIFLFLFKIGSVGPVDQINLVLPYMCLTTINGWSEFDLAGSWSKRFDQSENTEGNFTAVCDNTRNKFTNVITSLINFFSDIRKMFVNMLASTASLS